MRFANIIVDISHEKLDKTFQYRVPETLREQVEPGSRVVIPFGNGNRLIKGYVIGVGEKCQFDPGKIKDIAGIPEKENGVEDKMIALAAWIRRNYGCTMIQALKTVLPAKQSVKKLEHRQLVRRMGPDVTLTIVCGTNRRLYRRLTRRYRDDRRVQVLGYVEDMSALMDSANLCLTKPGGISTTEAAVKSLPMVLINAVSGCERYNLSYFTALGGAKTGAGVKALARTALRLLSSPRELTQMRGCLSPMGARNAAEIIYTQMKKLVEQRENEDPASCC